MHDLRVATKENTNDILDFGNVPAVFTMAANTTLRFENVTIKGVASRYVQGLRNNVTLVNLSLGLWPSVVLEPNATVRTCCLRCQHSTRHGAGSLVAHGIWQHIP